MLRIKFLLTSLCRNVIIRSRIGNKKTSYKRYIKNENDFVHSLYKMSFKAKEHSFNINIYYINIYQYKQAGG